MDLSSNNLSGEIPEEVTSLIILQSLNLSHNHFHRIIPENIGAMGSLESLDFSVNQLVGEIPSSTSRLTFLNYLNLSYKNLKGKIPSSTQLQSFDASSFLGNALWGAPLEENCTVVNETSAKEGGEGQGNKELNGVYVSMELGFVVSFLLTFGFLVIKRRWKQNTCTFTFWRAWGANLRKLYASFARRHINPWSVMLQENLLQAYLKINPRFSKVVPLVFDKP